MCEGRVQRGRFTVAPFGLVGGLFGSFLAAACASGSGASCASAIATASDGQVGLMLVDISMPIWCVLSYECVHAVDMMMQSAADALDSRIDDFSVISSGKIWGQKRNFWRGWYVG